MIGRDAEDLGISRLVAVPRAGLIRELIRAASEVEKHIRFQLDLRGRNAEERRLDLRFSADPSVAGTREFLAASGFAHDVNKGLYPREIVINCERADGLLTYVHELGHCFDFYGVEPYCQFSSATEASFEGWRQAVQQTEAWGALRVACWADYIELTDDWGGCREVEVDRKGALDAFTCHEAWARSFTQYVISHSERPVLAQLFGRTRHDERSALYGLYWSDEDFRLVATEIQRIFETPPSRQ